MKHNSAMPTTVSLLAAMLYAVTFSPSAATAQELVLVESGAAQAPIVLFEGAPPRTREAAEDLASYIEKVSDARPELVEKPTPPLHSAVADMTGAMRQGSAESRCLARFSPIRWSSAFSGGDFTQTYERRVS